MPREFTLPDLGEGIAEAQIVRVLVNEGDPVTEDQYLMEVETDKAAVEIPSPFAGVAKKIHVKEGDTVNVGDVIVTFDENGAVTGDQRTDQSRTAKAATETVSDEPREARRTAAPVAPERTTGAQERPSPDRGAAARKTTVPAAPAVRKLARDRGIDLETVEGTGPGGRVTKEDVERHAQGDRTAPAAPRRPSPAPGGPPPGIADADKWGSIRREPLSQIRKTIANQMSRSMYTIPHVTHCDECDVTELDRLRRSLNEATNNDPKLTIMAFVIRAVCIAMRKYPIFNASFDEEGQQIIYKEYVNMGIAVDSERGLIVPVIRNADQLSLRQIAAELRTLAERIRTNQFAIEDLRGGTFTITNVGALGGLFSTPIINYPEVAILGLGRSRKVPAIRSDDIEEAIMLPINLSFDHRATDGANAARYAGEIISYLQTPAKFLLD